MRKRKWVVYTMLADQMSKWQLRYHNKKKTIDDVGGCELYIKVIASILLNRTVGARR